MIDDKNKKEESQIQTNQTIEKSHLVCENGKILNYVENDTYSSSAYIYIERERQTDR